MIITQKYYQKKISELRKLCQKYRTDKISVSIKDDICIISNEYWPIKVELYSSAFIEIVQTGYFTIEKKYSEITKNDYHDFDFTASVNSTLLLQSKNKYPNLAPLFLFLTGLMINITGLIYYLLNEQSYGVQFHSRSTPSLGQVVINWQTFVFFGCFIILTSIFAYLLKRNK